MKTISTVLYEIENMRELEALPFGSSVLRYDKQFGYHRILEKGIDKFSPDTKRYVYLLLAPPPLPKINAEYSQSTEATV